MKIKKKIKTLILTICFFCFQTKTAASNTKTFGQIIKIFQNDAKRLNKLFEARKTLANNIKENNLNPTPLTKLSTEEYETQFDIFTDFFQINKTTEEKNIIKFFNNATMILQKITDASKYRKLNEKFKNTHEYRKTKEYFLNIKITIKNYDLWKKVEALYLEGDRHCATAWNENPTFFLGDISDRGLSLSENQENQDTSVSLNNGSMILFDEDKENDVENLSNECFFKLQKTIYLILRNLAFHIDTLNSLGDGSFLQKKEDPFFFSVLGNHDYGGILSRDLARCINSYKQYCGTQKFEELQNLLDASMRCFIPTQTVFCYDDKCIVTSHSGGELLLPDDTEQQNFYNAGNYTAETFEYNFYNKNIYKKFENLKKMLTDEELLKFLKFSNLITNKRNLSNPFSWCDFFKDFYKCIGKDEKEREDIFNNISQEDGRFSLGLHYTQLLNIILSMNYNIPTKTKFIRCRAHEHDSFNIKYFFIRPQDNAYICEIGQTTWFYMPPAYPIENQYCNEAINKDTKQISSLEFLTKKINTIESLFKQKANYTYNSPSNSTNNYRHFSGNNASNTRFDYILKEEFADICHKCISFFDELSRNITDNPNFDDLFKNILRSKDSTDIAYNIFKTYSFLLKQNNITEIRTRWNTVLADNEVNITYKQKLIKYYEIYKNFLEKFGIETNKLIIPDNPNLKENQQNEYQEAIESQIDTLVSLIQADIIKEIENQLSIFDIFKNTESIMNRLNIKEINNKYDFLILNESFIQKNLQKFQTKMKNNLFIISAALIVSIFLFVFINYYIFAKQINNISKNSPISPDYKKN